MAVRLTETGVDGVYLLSGGIPTPLPGGVGEYLVKVMDEGHKRRGRKPKAEQGQPLADAEVDVVEHRRRKPRRVSVVKVGEQAVTGGDAASDVSEA